ncbi:MAG: hypothetical protein ACE5HF_07040 [Gemmatimonadota bacterium]
MSEQAPDGEAGAAGRSATGIDPILRAKYLDYCSARISEVFLSLTDERTYALMEEAAQDSRLEVGSLSFQNMMRLVTRKLQESVPLPDLETWVAEYRENPDRYDPLLLGLWKRALDTDGEEGSS